MPRVWPAKSRLRLTFWRLKRTRPHAVTVAAFQSISCVTNATLNFGSDITLSNSPNLLFAGDGSTFAAGVISGDGLLSKEDAGTLRLSGANTYTGSTFVNGGELIVCNFDSDSVSIIETSTDEVSGSYLIGTRPTRAVVSSDNSRLYVSNFGSNAIAVYDIDIGRIVATLTVGSQPDGLALSASQNYLLVLDSQSGDVTVIQKRKPRKLEPGEYGLLTMIPAGERPNNIAVKSFMLPPK